ncbi:MAG TPA: 30S ribosomal protein S3 [Spirochaetota bacterium]|nr:30S ribosomal protein S3 [Spirochaetota bacterium]HPP03276.1 30S ribosomal protein S3 [Spirochaetota bacterium]
MGQKVNPIGLRIGINKYWDSVWFSEKKNYAKFLHEDIKIRNLIQNYNFSGDDKNRKSVSDVARVEIFRKPDRITIIIHTARAGVIVGVDGKNISDLTKKIAKITSSKIEIKIKEIKKPEINASLVAANIAKQIMNRVPFRRAMKKAIADAKKMNIPGIKVQCSGRLGGADIARTEWYREGRIPLHTLRADIDYGTANALTTYGITGIKVWIFHREIFKKDIKEDAGQLIKRPRRKGKESKESDE